MKQLGFLFYAHHLPDWENELDSRTQAMRVVYIHQPILGSEISQMVAKRGADDTKIDLFLGTAKCHFLSNV